MTETRNGPRTLVRDDAPVQTETEAPVRSFWRLADALLRPAGAGVAAGIAAGLVGAGGSRVAMRIVGAASDPCRGLVTENGNPCGVFTAEGTIGLIVFVGIFAGVGGGALYAAYAPWLRGLGRRRGLVFGLLLLAGLGFTVFQPDNADFERFANPVTNIATFAVLFPLFGVIVAPVADAIERRLPHLPPSWPPRVVAVPGYAVMAAPLLFGVLFGLGTLGLGLLAAAMLVGIHRMRVLIGRTEGVPAVAVAGAHALAAAPVAVGAVVTVRALVRIAGL